MMRESLIDKDEFPREMRVYLRNFGFHFNEKACEYAVSMMRRRDRNGKEEPIDPWKKSQVDELLKKYNITLDNNMLHDATYVANMAKADFLGKSLANEQAVAQYVKDVLDDVDARDGVVFIKWYAASMFNGVPIDFSQLL